MLPRAHNQAAESHRATTGNSSSTGTEKESKRANNSEQRTQSSSNTEALATQVLDAHHALREVAESPVVPFRFKRPLIVNFVYGKISKERLLPVMKAYDTIRVHAIATSKPLTEPPKKIVLKRRHAAAAEAPVCSRLSDTHVLWGAERGTGHALEVRVFQGRAAPRRL